jgi:hypothetical protein
MDGDVADLRVGAQQGDLAGVDEQHLAFDPVARIVGRPHAGARAGLRVAFLRFRAPGRCRRGAAGNRQRLIWRHLAALAMADRFHAISPGDDPGVGIELGTAVDVPPAVEPDDVIGREVGDAGRVAQKIAPAVVEHLGQPLDLRPHQMPVADRGFAHRLD